METEATRAAALAAMQKDVRDAVYQAVARFDSVMVACLADPVLRTATAANLRQGAETARKRGALDTAASLDGLAERVETGT